MRSAALTLSSLLLVAALLTTACHADDGEGGEGADVPISFATLAADADEAATRSATRAGATGFISSTADLQGVDIGVYSAYTGASTWADAGAKTMPNFMYNEQLSYVYIDSDGNQAWQYSPVKYWPNDNQPADDQDNNLGTAPATGSQAHSYLSFFAYAPFTGSDDGTMPAPATGETGIIGQTANNATGAPRIRYRLAAGDLDRQVDLMWATRQDCYKTMPEGYGRTTGRVPLEFRHALVRLDVEVQRVYDETSPATGKHPDNDKDTKIFVSSLTLSPDGYRQEAWLNLSDGSWHAAEPATPAAPLVYRQDDIADAVSGSPLGNDAAIAYLRDAELNKWGNEGVGVTETPRLLHKAQRTFLLLPQDAELRLTPRITYSFVTRDNALELPATDYLTDSNGNRYLRILNDITADAPISVYSLVGSERRLVGGKRYTLRCLIGVESVQFQVVGVEDWDFPLRFTTEVGEYQEQDPIERTLNEE